LHLKVFQFISSRIPLFIFFSSKSWENNSWKALWRLKSQQVDGGGYAGDPLIWPYIFCWHNFLCPKRTKRTEPEMSASPCSCRSRRPCGGWPVKRGAGNTLYVLLNLKIWKLFMSMWKLNSGPHKRDLFVRLGLIRSMQWNEMKRQQNRAKRLFICPKLFHPPSPSWAPAPLSSPSIAFNFLPSPF